MKKKIKLSKKGLKAIKNNNKKIKMKYFLEKLKILNYMKKVKRKYWIN